MNKVALDPHEEISIITDNTTINTAIEMGNFERKRLKLLECTGLPSLTLTRWNLQIPGEDQLNKTDGDARICGLPQNLRRGNQMKHRMYTLTVQEQFHSLRTRLQQRFTTSYLTNHLPDIGFMHILYFQGQESIQDLFVSHILLKYRAEIKRLPTIDQPKLNSHLPTIMADTTEGAATTEKEGTGK
ncbi:MAG: hypothetical protein EZS28_037473 [Streblomastix strix]|uniref:Uncharacterized protein n=1 Tax=Streblomastix strix TaxID=222440 RepID=A0A5J4U9Y9_9EUKA|nr:MAG: hypothetical protein EZS28_037473 [Streblomastix strix]